MSATRINNLAPPGSLLKQPRPVKRRTMPLRERDESYLAKIRKCPCVSCGQDPAGEAAHVRMSSSVHGKPNPGMANKPDDKWCLPLCHECHSRQHEIGELSFWNDLAIHPILLCLRLSTAGSLEAMRAVCMEPRS